MADTTMPITAIKLKAIGNNVLMEKPTASTSTPPTVGEMNAPRANAEVHKP